MVEVKGGTFTMGDDNSNYEDDKPAHKVKLDTFYMAEFQVTQELYEAVMKQNPAGFKGKRRPVEKVTWRNCVDFCVKLNEILELEQPVNNSTDDAVLDLTKKGFRLPTEAEWEYAARGGVVVETGHAAFVETGHALSLRYAGSDVLNPVGWYDANSKMETRQVGLKMPNELGLYDMSGNVYEWCWDWYNKKFYEECKIKEPFLNPIDNNNIGSRVLRGGSWSNYAVLSRVANRDGDDPDFAWYNNGFRLVFSF